MKYHGTATPLLDGEQIAGEQRRLLLGQVSADLLVVMMVKGAVVALFAWLQPVVPQEGTVRVHVIVDIVVVVCRVRGQGRS